MSISPPHVLHQALTVVVNGNPPPPFPLFLQTIKLTATTGQMKVLRCDQARRFLTCCFSGSSAHSEDAKSRSYHNQSILKSLHLLMTFTVDWFIEAFSQTQRLDQHQPPLKTSSRKPNSCSETPGSGSAPLPAA